MKCARCGGPMAQLLTSMYCVAECDEQRDRTWEAIGLLQKARDICGLDSTAWVRHPSERSVCVVLVGSGYDYQYEFTDEFLCSGESMKLAMFVIHDLACDMWVDKLYRDQLLRLLNYGR